MKKTLAKKENNFKQLCNYFRFLVEIRIFYIVLTVFLCSSSLLVMFFSEPAGGVLLGLSALILLLTGDESEEYWKTYDDIKNFDHSSFISSEEICETFKEIEESIIKYKST